MSKSLHRRYSLLLPIWIVTLAAPGLALAESGGGSERFNPDSAQRVRALNDHNLSTAIAAPAGASLKLTGQSLSTAGFAAASGAPLAVGLSVARNSKEGGSGKALFAGALTAALSAPAVGGGSTAIAAGIASNQVGSTLSPDKKPIPTQTAEKQRAALPVSRDIILAN